MDNRKGERWFQLGASPSCPASAAFAGLARGVGASRNENIQAESLSLEQAGAIARAWSQVHGFSILVLEDRMSDILRRLPKGTTLDQLFEAMLRSPGPGPRPPA